MRVKDMKFDQKTQLEGHMSRHMLPEIIPIDSTTSKKHKAIATRSSTR